MKLRAIPFFSRSSSGVYRDDARLRIDTLEARLAERDAKLAEVNAELARVKAARNIGWSSIGARDVIAVTIGAATLGGAIYWTGYRARDVAEEQLARTAVTLASSQRQSRELQATNQRLLTEAEERATAAAVPRDPPAPETNETAAKSSGNAVPATVYKDTRSPRDP